MTNQYQSHDQPTSYPNKACNPIFLNITPTNHNPILLPSFHNPFLCPSEIFELEDPGKVRWQVLFGVPGGGPETLQPSVPVGKYISLNTVVKINQFLK